MMPAIPIPVLACIRRSCLKYDVGVGAGADAGIDTGTGAGPGIPLGFDCTLPEITGSSHLETKPSL